MAPLRAASRALGAVVALGAVSGSVAAHSGTTHAGTPHWLLFVLAALGLVSAVLALAAYRRRRLAGPVAAPVGLLAALVGAFGLVGLVELQVVAETGPQIRDVYPTLSLVVGAAMAIGSLVVGRLRWITRIGALAFILSGGHMAGTLYTLEALTGTPRGHLVLTMLGLWFVGTGLVEVAGSKLADGLDAGKLREPARDAKPLLYGASAVAVGLIVPAGLLASPTLF